MFSNLHFDQGTFPSVSGSATIYSDSFPLLCFSRVAHKCCNLRCQLAWFVPFIQNPWCWLVTHRKQSTIKSSLKANIPLSMLFQYLRRKLMLSLEGLNNIWVSKTWCGFKGDLNPIQSSSWKFTWVFRLLLFLEQYYVCHWVDYTLWYSSL